MVKIMNVAVDTTTKKVTNVNVAITTINRK
jgi:hypothetical protein